MLGFVPQTNLPKLNSNRIGEIHLSHNKGKADTHDLIPSDIWFKDLTLTGEVPHLPEKEVSG
ncbi:MAG: hypothetical protein KI793_17100 [Rivularia sp. (in: Bacteria)]|nr:hypothetical protein [Rivularia sp. MS3]